MHVWSDKGVAGIAAIRNQHHVERETPPPTTRHPSPNQHTRDERTRAAAPTSRLTRVRAPATCGELIQGALNGADFLVNCPIDLFAEVELTDAVTDGLGIEDEGDFGKISAALEQLAASSAIGLGHRLRIRSPIPRGKGMASSTADITAALGAFIRHHDLHLDDAAFGRLIASVEPSDCVHYAGIAEVNHLSGALHACYAVPRGLRALIVDCGGEVDTQRFDRARARALYAAHRDEVAGFVTELRNGLRCGDPAAVGRAATRSARLSQRILPKAGLEDLVRVTARVGAVGVNCAHSGTVLGVLYADHPGRGRAIRRAVEREFGADLNVVGDHAVIAGGWHVEC